jgi:hypothetical protein
MDTPTKPVLALLFANGDNEKDQEVLRAQIATGELIQSDDELGPFLETACKALYETGADPISALTSAFICGFSYGRKYELILQSQSELARLEKLAGLDDPRPL